MTLVTGSLTGILRLYAGLWLLCKFLEALCQSNGPMQVYEGLLRLYVGLRVLSGPREVPPRPREVPHTGFWVLYRSFEHVQVRCVCGPMQVL